MDKYELIKLIEQMGDNDAGERKITDVIRCNGWTILPVSNISQGVVGNFADNTDANSNDSSKKGAGHKSYLNSNVWASGSSSRPLGFLVVGDDVSFVSVDETMSNICKNSNGDTAKNCDNICNCSDTDSLFDFVKKGILLLLRELKGDKDL